MLHTLLAANHDALVDRCRKKSARRFAPEKIRAAIDHGVPSFLRQLTDTLLLENEEGATHSPFPVPTPSETKIGRDAALHGAEMLRLGYSIDQVVHEYGDVCQSVTDLAVDRQATISAAEFRTLNRCLDDAIADAVTSFGRAKRTSAAEQANGLEDRVKAFSAEQQRLVTILAHSYAAIKTGQVGVVGATGTLLLRTLDELHGLVDRLLPEFGSGP